MNRAVKKALRPVRSLVTTFALNVLVCAVLFSVFEEDTGDKGPIWALYWAVTTATTTGYGDISPMTVPGQIIAMWLMVTSLVLFAIVTAHIVMSMINDPHLFSDEEQTELLDDTDDCVVMLVELLKFHNIAIPDSVEEAHTERSNNDTNA